jgi:hypothetical protein
MIATTPGAAAGAAAALAGADAADGEDAGADGWLPPQAAVSRKLAATKEKEDQRRFMLKILSHG